MRHLKTIISVIVLLFAVASTAQADLREDIWSDGTHHVYSSFRAYGGTGWTEIATGDPRRGYYVLLPQYVYFQWAFNNDIWVAANYASTHGLPWIWGSCLQVRNAYNAINCLYDPFIYGGP